MKNLWTIVRKKLSEGVKRALSALRRLGDDRARLGRLAYYAGTAALLAALGMASHAYRNRPVAASTGPQVAAVARTNAAEAETLPEESPVRWIWPLEGEILTGYSDDTPIWSTALGQWQLHQGLDIAGHAGEVVMACADGVVVDRRQDRLWGNVIVIDHGEGFQSTYAGLNTLNMVEDGQAVRAGETIGSVGDTAAVEADAGWHLHFELSQNGVPQDFAALIGEN